MSDQKCDVCEKDPGPGSACQHCGSRQYRYATDELYAETASFSEKTDESDAVARALRERIQGMADDDAGDRQLSVDDSSDAWSMAQQSEAIEKLEQTDTGPMGEGKKATKGRGCLGTFLLIFAIAAIGLVAGVVAISRNSDSIEDFFDEIVTETVVDTSALLDPIDLESWSDVVVGDCFDEDRDEDGIYPPIIVDCRSSHDGEFSFIGDLPQDAWPGAETASSTADALCIEQFEAYVGVEYSESVWYSTGLYPSQDQWDDGDKTFHCYLYLPDTTAFERAAGSRK